jgi:general secretion pathway protein I
MRKRNAGFSLLEVLVAFVILGLVLGVLMQIFSGGLRNIGVAGEYQHAVLLGQSKLVAIGIETPLAPGEKNGEFDSTYRWHVSIRPFLEGQAPAGELESASAKLLEIEVRVSWGGAEQPRSINLKTLRLTPTGV